MNIILLSSLSINFKESPSKALTAKTSKAHIIFNFKGFKRRYKLVGVLLLVVIKLPVVSIHILVSVHILTFSFKPVKAD